ncbi:hypothetical protein E2C01_051874 [Portunus trituberculatus]|uniref:Uncharacterized protein n=1 Tax=Portunus trituberculatus TaxID=210409 RepID=A0A5B7GK82_PORTR|nr:hypothetical protein [Portunus trituberculatus]
MALIKQDRPTSVLDPHHSKFNVVKEGLKPVLKSWWGRVMGGDEEGRLLKTAAQRKAPSCVSFRSIHHATAAYIPRGLRFVTSFTYYASGATGHGRLKARFTWRPGRTARRVERCPLILNTDSRGVLILYSGCNIGAWAAPPPSSESRARPNDQPTATAPQHLTDFLGHCQEFVSSTQLNKGTHTAASQHHVKPAGCLVMIAVTTTSTANTRRMAAEEKKGRDVKGRRRGGLVVVVVVVVVCLASLSCQRFMPTLAPQRTRRNSYITMWEL